jgi:hypothetical protein
MKKFLIVTLLIALYSGHVFAQELHLGVKGGADMRKISNSLFQDKFSFGYHLGGFVQLGLTKSIIFQPEVYFSQTSYDTAEGFNQVLPNAITISQLKLGYLNIPLLLGLKINQRLMLQAGPQFGILMNKSEDLKSNGKDALKKGDVSMVAGLQITAASFIIYGRYQAGLSDLSGDAVLNQSSWKSQTIHLGVGLRF